MTPRYAHTTDSVKSTLKTLLTGVCGWASSKKIVNTKLPRANVTPPTKKSKLSVSVHTLIGSGKSAATTVAVYRIAPEQKIVMCLKVSRCNLASSIPRSLCGIEA
jgi:hypothetical protein